MATKTLQSKGSGALTKPCVLCSFLSATMINADRSGDLKMTLEESGEMAQLDRNLSSDPQNPYKNMLGIASHACNHIPILTDVSTALSSVSRIN